MAIEREVPSFELAHRRLELAQERRGEVQHATLLEAVAYAVLYVGDQIAQQTEAIATLDVTINNAMVTIEEKL